MDRRLAAALPAPVPAPGRNLDRERRSSALGVAGLDGIRQPGEDVRAHRDPIDHHLQGAPAGQAPRIDVVERDRPVVDEQAAEALAPQGLERAGQGVGSRDDGLRPRRPPAAGRAAAGGSRPFRSPATAARRGRLLGRRARAVALRRGRSRRSGDRQVESDQQPRAGRPRGEAAGRDLGRLPDDRLPAAAADRPADPREQQAQVVVHLDRRADGRARIADAVLLADRDRGADAVDAVHVRLLHPLEKLPGVGRERLHVAALPFRVHGVERQGGLPRAADTGDDDDLPLRQRQIDVLQIVRARAPNGDASVRRLTGPLRHASGSDRAWLPAPRLGLLRPPADACAPADASRGEPNRAS